jgi:hypothetical protein
MFDIAVECNVGGGRVDRGSNHCAESNVHSPPPCRSIRAPPSCFVGNTMTSDPNMEPL